MEILIKNEIMRSFTRLNKIMKVSIFDVVFLAFLFITINVNGQSENSANKGISIPETFVLGTSDGVISDYSLSTLKKTRNLGIQFLEVSTRWFNNLDFEEQKTLAKEMRENAESAGIQLWSIHLPYGNEYDVSSINDSVRLQAIINQKRYIDIASLLGVKRMVLHPSVDRIPDIVRKLHIEALRSSLEELIEYSEKRNLSLNIENLPRACLGNSIREIEMIIEGFPSLGICADVNHMKDVRPEDFISHFGEKIKMIHMADYDRVDEKHWPPGWGENNWNNIILELIQAKYDGPFIYEVVSRFATVEELSENYKNLINNFKGWINNI